MMTKELEWFPGGDGGVELLYDSPHSYVGSIRDQHSFESRVGVHQQDGIRWQTSQNERQCLGLLTSGVLSENL